MSILDFKSSGMMSCSTSIDAISNNIAGNGPQDLISSLRLAIKSLSNNTVNNDQKTLLRSLSLVIKLLQKSKGQLNNIQEFKSSYTGIKKVNKPYIYQKIVISDKKFIKPTPPLSEMLIKSLNGSAHSNSSVIKLPKLMAEPSDFMKQFPISKYAK